MEKYKKGGYTILDLESSTIYADSVKALDSNKPVVVYDTNKPYFADTIVLDGTNVVITKGGKTITIANDNTITNVGDIQLKVFGLYVGHSSDDESVHLVAINNINVILNNKNFDEQPSISGLYKLVTSIKGNAFKTKFFNDNKELISIVIYKNGSIIMEVDTNEVLNCKVNEDDTITYTTNTDYFYISNIQIFE